MLLGSMGSLTYAESNITSTTEETKEVQAEVPLTTEITDLPDGTTAELGEVAEIPPFTENEKYFKIVGLSQTIRLDSIEQLGTLLSIENVKEYDNALVSYATSIGLTLNDYNDKQLAFSETPTSLSLSASMSNSRIDSSELNFKSASFEKLYICVDAVNDGKICQSEQAELNILPTAYGFFVSKYDKAFAYDKYAVYLYDNGLITDVQLKDIRSTITDLVPVNEIDTSKHAQETVRYFDSITQAVKSSTKDDYLNYKYSLLLNSTYENDNSNEPLERNIIIDGTSLPVSSISITRTIRVQTSTRLIVDGYIRWKDIEDNEHPAISLQVHVMDDDINNADDELGYVYTGTNGYYVAVIENQLDNGDGGCDIYLRIETKTGFFNVKSSESNIFEDGYYITTPTTQNVTGAVDWVSYQYDDNTNNTCAYKAVYIHQAMKTGSTYYFDMNDGVTQFVNVVYPDTGDYLLEGDSTTDDTSYYSSSEDIIVIATTDYCDWDIVLHEYGHFVAEMIDIYSQFGDIIYWTRT